MLIYRGDARETPGQREKKFPRVRCGGWPHGEGNPLIPTPTPTHVTFPSHLSYSTCGGVEGGEGGGRLTFFFFGGGGGAGGTSTVPEG